MLKLSDIQKKHSTAEKTIKVEAWGGDVKIRDLTVAESADVVATRMRGEAGMSVVKTASYALIEPAMTVADISAMSEDAFDGVSEIVKAIGEFKPEKK